MNSIHPAVPPSPQPWAAIAPITEAEFTRFAQLIFRLTGISLCPAKKMMVASRLQRRLQHYQLQHFDDYYALVSGPDYPEERQMLIDLLTTNETYFFRESSHFDFLAEQLQQHPVQPVRVWSAACSSGEEVYSLAMVLSDVLGPGGWQLVGSDVSQRVLQQARRGHYPISRNEGISMARLKKYCLKGVGPQQGTFLIDRRLQASIEFRQQNLKESLVAMGRFDVIFLRNVLIYFNPGTKREIVTRLSAQLNPGGLLFISHTENLQGIDCGLVRVEPSIYRKA